MLKSLLFILVLLTASLAACQSCESPRQSLPLLEAIKSHEVAIRGIVMKVGGPPLLGAGVFEAQQLVTYKVLDVYKGKVPLTNGQTEVTHVLSYHGPMEVPGAGKLREDLFTVGTEVLLFGSSFSPGDPMHIESDDPFGVVILRRAKKEVSK